jgi:hypothetical protein
MALATSPEEVSANTPIDAAGLFRGVWGLLLSQLGGDEVSLPSYDPVRSAPGGDGDLLGSVAIYRTTVVRPVFPDEPWLLGLGNYEGDMGSFLKDVLVAMPLKDFGTSTRKIRWQFAVRAHQCTALSATIFGQLLWRGLASNVFLHRMREVLQERRVSFPDLVGRKKIRFAHPEFTSPENEGVEFEIFSYRADTINILAESITRSIGP